MPRGTIPSLLGGSGNIDCDHDSHHNTEVINGNLKLSWKHDLGKEGEEVWDAGDISGDVEWVEVLLMIHAHPNRGSISRRGRDDVHLVFTIQVAGEV